VDEEGRREGHASTWQQARWLAAEELRRTWPSYPLTGLMMLLFGLFAAAFFELALGAEEPFGDFPADVFFLAAALNLAVNSVSRDYLSSWNDSFSRRLSFLRSLPIPVPALVAGRLLTMLTALPLTVPALFLPPYLLSDALREALDPAQYLAFVAMWVGYALLCAGFWLYSEFNLPGKTYNYVVFGILALMLLSVGLAEWLLDARLTERTVGLVQSYGALPAALALVVGAAGLALGAWTTTVRLGKRDLAV
jgi:hypothetical protein